MSSCAQTHRAHPDTAPEPAGSRLRLALWNRSKPTRHSRCRHKLPKANPSPLGGERVRGEGCSAFRSHAAFFKADGKWGQCQRPDAEQIHGQFCHPARSLRATCRFRLPAGRHKAPAATYYLPRTGFSLSLDCLLNNHIATAPFFSFAHNDVTLLSCVLGRSLVQFFVQLRPEDLARNSDAAPKPINPQNSALRQRILLIS